MSEYKRIHMYERQEGGSLQHRTTFYEDLGGPITVTGDVEPLMGWPTPAMRRAVDGAGYEASWYVGTDVDGEIIRCS